jgi:hypothetical protein
MAVREIVCECVDRVQLVQDNVQSRTLVNTATKRHSFTFYEIS